MQSLIFSALEWIKAKWGKIGLFWRVLCIVAGLALAGLLVVFVPLIGPLKEAYTRTGPHVQLMFLTVGLLLLLGAFWFGIDEWHRVKRLTAEKESAESAKAAAERSAAAAVAEAQKRASAAEEEAARLQAQWDHLLAVGCRDVLWKRPPVVVQPPFVPKSNRKTRFVTVLNLKGGVGKTTLTANLAAGLASGPNPLRVLLIDIDFQGTLSRATVEGPLIAQQVKHDDFVHKLLKAPEPSAPLLNQLATTMNGFATGRVILADESLDAEEFQLQARFFVDSTLDPRFRFRLHLHQPFVFDNYDVVLFDSPPRVTTSVVNALACSDHVLIPTKLDNGSIDAVPRTLKWMKSLGAICPADVLGVVASHAALRAGVLVKADNENYEYLRAVIESECGDRKKLCTAVVQGTPKAVGTDGKISGRTDEGQQVFAAVIKEVRKRMGL